MAMHAGAEGVPLDEIPAKVQRIHVDGLTRTKDDIVAKQLRSVFRATTFKEMIVEATAVRDRMLAMGLFKNASLYVDIMRGEGARPDGYEIEYRVKELKRFSPGYKGWFGTDETSGTVKQAVTLRFPNLFGRAEQLSGEYTYTTNLRQSQHGYGLRFHKPLLGNPDLTFDAGLFRHGGDYPWSGYQQTDRGVFADFSIPTILGQHVLRWEGVWRELACLTQTTAFAVREQAGHSLKSSVMHTWTHDTRDDRMLPRSGTFIHTVQELAGLGGSAHFVKSNMEALFTQPLPFSSSLQLSFGAGTMKSMAPNKHLSICDKFLLGGPLTLRGFNLNGCGPQQEGSALGADTYFLAGLHLYTPLPFNPGKGGFGEFFRTHFFLNAGNSFNVDSISLASDPKQAVNTVIDSTRWSYGVGVAFKFGAHARMELNYCWPRGAQPGDSTNPGLQFGIGVHYL